MNTQDTYIPQFYKPLEVAAKLKLSRAAIYRLLKSGQIKSIKLGGSRLISENQLAEFLRGLFDQND
jgi:excisionase family DNA binding protein